MSLDDLITAVKLKEFCKQYNVPFPTKEDILDWWDLFIHKLPLEKLFEMKEVLNESKADASYKNKLSAMVEYRIHELEKTENLQLVKSENFGALQVDFYGDGNDFWMTRRQIGESLEYDNPSDAIKNIHLRHKDRLDYFSRGAQIELPSGGSQQTTIYSAKGVYEICRWSRQPKADDFYDWVYDLLESLRTGKSQIVNIEPPKPEKPVSDIKRMEVEARYRNSKTRQANLLLKMADKFKDRLSDESVHSLLANAAEVASDRPILEKPKFQKTYTAGDIAKLAGVTANKVGRIANANDLKHKPYGDFVLDKSRHSDKQVSTFVYFEEGKNRLLELITD